MTARGTLKRQPASAERVVAAPVAGETALADAWSRRVLFCVCGLSPQVVTESVYALACAVPARERFVPTEVHILTTVIGAERAAASLLAPGTGAFARLVADYQLPEIMFDERCIHTVPDSAGRPLADIRTDSDNVCLADAVTHWVRTFTQDSRTALHVSLAGGRKTMSFYAGYVLSLLGRPQDRLSHVLVDPALESSPDFFYPSPRRMGGGSFTNVDSVGAPVGPRSPQLGLALIPFVRLRDGLPRTLLEGRSGFAQTVAAANAGRAPPSLLLDSASHTVVADGIGIRLPPFQFSLLAALAIRAQRKKPALRAPAPLTLAPSPGGGKP